MAPQHDDRCVYGSTSALMCMPICSQGRSLCSVILTSLTREQTHGAWMIEGLVLRLLHCVRALSALLLETY
jgi:hypothetical protein